MLIRLKGGRVVDPVNNRDAVGDVFIDNGRIVEAPEGRQPDQTYDVSGKVVMAGAVDVHSHIGGSNVTLARQLMPELPYLAASGGVAIPPNPSSWGAYATGLRYAQMGYTTVIEPAVQPTHAIQTHLELAQIPMIDTGGLIILGNDDFALRQLHRKASKNEIEDYVAWTLQHARGIGLKVINAGGAEAFKFNARTFDLDDEVPEYGTTSRQIVQAMQHAVQDLGVPHPAHVHCNNLGIAGNIDTAIATIEASDGVPIHFAHIQFYSYGKEGEKGFSSAAPRLVEALKAHPNVTVDVGQPLFGQTVTISGDVLRQFDGRKAASPGKWALYQGEGNGTGVVPYKYKAKSFINAVQWAIGLEIFLLADSYWQVLFSTDHPNGALFTRYPEIFQLLMDKDERARWLDKLPEGVKEATNLAEIEREITLSDLAVMTRAAPAKLLGLTDRGHLSPGAVGDVAVYTDKPNKAEMFDRASYVFKDGKLIMRDGDVVEVTWGKVFQADPGFDSKIERRVKDFYGESYGIDPKVFGVPEDIANTEDRFQMVPCRT
ncbi:formylmethanofuran dehydrogenase subunit A [Methyloligella sp. 2.7D]|uniref:formylmethanofuran dehydrogenase subunit A n=1 Tax=unclassified Methyloligella TaxID=2625955 RepID=UPI00157BFE26|nr:formylmethanofuran dehydrogenase subunit A [Methyloligella sp. GL2]QKP77772.1 formylmethanofuran dehydrogenase subunit A [Methyloligella sp. GL2]